MSLKHIGIVVSLLVLITIGFWLSRKSSTNGITSDIYTTIRKSEFHVRVSSTGELQAKNSEQILGPQGMRSVGIWQTNITDIVPEGTLVKEGDYVAALDRTELANKMRDKVSEIERSESQLIQAKLDTAIEMRGLRNQLINFQFSLREKNIELEQSKYEPPAVIRAVQLDLERVQRELDQSTKNYSLKKEQAEAKIQEIVSTLEQHKTKLSQMQELAASFNVTAPKEGMVIYERTWQGKKGAGAQISAWSPVVANLPDLSDMISVSYVNEVDISKVKTGQDVEIKVDAFPDMSFSGKVIAVANVGEQKPGFDAKVFEVKIQLLQSDSILRPAMTTATEILTATISDVIAIPIDCLQSNDSISYVFKKSQEKIVKQEVMLGISNDNQTVIEYGLQENDIVLLSIPQDADKLTTSFIDPAIREKELKRIQQLELERKKQAEEKALILKKDDASAQQMSTGSTVIIVE